MSEAGQPLLQQNANQKRSILDSLLILFFSGRLFIFGAYQALTQLGGQFVLSL
jgi:hypothetical protein